MLRTLMTVIGQVVGSQANSALYLSHGYRASGGFSLAMLATAILVLCARGPHMLRYEWIGWKGGAELRKSRVKSREDRREKADVEASKADVQAES